MFLHRWKTITAFSPKDGQISNLEINVYLCIDRQTPSESHSGLKAWKEPALHYDVRVMSGC